MSRRVMVLFGTRPECIKLAPVVRALRARPDDFHVTVCSTGQHREMLHMTLQSLGLTVDEDLDVMRPDQTLPQLTGAILSGCAELIRRHSPDWMLVQGDTTTAFVGALAAFYGRVRIGHVEAGLRTGRKDNPFPEEINRRLITPMADLHFAPTPRAAAALLAEGVSSQSVHVTGNTGIDALLALCARWQSGEQSIDPSGNYAADHAGSPEGVEPAVAALAGASPLVLITCHRRENFGPELEAICKALRHLAETWPAAQFVFPVHLNPSVRRAVMPLLGGIANLHLLEPVAYDTMVFLMRRATLILTDSGGIQEEAPTFGVPVLVMRATTERQESVEAGFARLVGSNADMIVAEASRILSAGGCPELSGRPNPYGDGHAAERIAAILAETP
ncbi:MAG: UDP-N-acetylglucosamine 2-epimerase (non-hydrolyzing) [Acetobacter papayae]